MPKRKCKFSSDLQTKFPCFRNGRNENEAECLICGGGTFVSVANKGLSDLKAHIDTEKHKKAVRGNSSQKMTNYIIKENSMESDAVAAAEGTYAFHTAKHHHSYKSMDCSSRLPLKLFPDSNITKKFTCARTKTEAIVNSVLAPYSVQSALETLEKNAIEFCSVATDGSNHNACKLFPVVVLFFDYKNGGLQSKLIEVTSAVDETAETIACLVKKTLEECKLVSKCIAFTGDNCNTMFGGCERGGQNNVFAKLKRSLNKESLVGVGCPAHILNNCLHHAVGQVAAVDIESIINKIYQYFHIYTVRTEQLRVLHIC